MQEQKSFTTIMLEIISKPHASIALMGAVGLLGLSTGFITYQDSTESVAVSQSLDTALPAISNISFKNNKYDNAVLIPSEDEQDSVFLPGLLGEENAPIKTPEPDRTNKPIDNGFSSNENQMARNRNYSDEQASFWKSRSKVRAHYNGKLSERAMSNEQIIQQMTAPAPLSEQELSERRSREQALAKAEQLEQMAINQLEMAQNRSMDRTHTGVSGSLKSNDTAMETGLPPAHVTLANLDEQVEVPRFGRPQNSFYGLKGERIKPEMISSSPVPNAIEAVIHGDANQVTVTNGSTIKLRLLQDIQVGNYLLPQNSLLSGECVISGERVQVALTSVRVKSSIIPIKLRVYDIDGHAGIYVPDLAVKNQIAQTGAQTVTGGSLNMPYMIPSGGGIGEMLVGQTAVQGANLAVNGIRTLAAKKMSQQKVTIRPNYRVYLKQEGQ